MKKISLILLFILVGLASVTTAEAFNRGNTSFHSFSKSKKAMERKV